MEVGRKQSSTVSAVVATKGRTSELTTLLDSLAAQSVSADEIIVVDQNDDLRVKPILERFPHLPIKHLHEPSLVGLSASRNHGWKRMTGDLAFFPDDDCWYPSNFIASAITIFGETQADIISGRAADRQGRSINGRFAKRSGWVNRRSVWQTQIEWAVFFRAEVLEAVDGYDEKLGAGAPTEWGANEGQDLSLCALAAGYRQYYTPNFYGFHKELNDGDTSPDYRIKTKHYAKGFGYVLGKHRYSALTAAYWVTRPVLGAGISLLKLNRSMAQTRLIRATGRLAGYVDGVRFAR